MWGKRLLEKGQEIVNSNPHSSFQPVADSIKVVLAKVQQKLLRCCYHLCCYQEIVTLHSLQSQVVGTDSETSCTELRREDELNNHGVEHILSSLYLTKSVFRLNTSLKQWFLVSFSGSFYCWIRLILMYAAWTPEEISLKFCSQKLSILRSLPKFKFFALRASLVLPKLYSMIKDILNING